MAQRLQDLADQMTAKITLVAESATEEERRKVAEFRLKAVDHAVDPQVEIHLITHPMAGLLFLDGGTFNRGWDPEWSLTLAQMMSLDRWLSNSQGYALYGFDGSVADGRHRLGAQAYSETTLSVAIYFGMTRDAVGTLDCGKKRTPADAATLAGVVNAKAKAALLQAIWSYEKSAGIANHVNTYDVTAVAKEIERNDALLSRSLEVGQTSLQDAIDPLLGEGAAAKLVGVLLRHSWPEARVVERLDEVQTSDFISEKAPLAVARAFIAGHRRPVDTLPTQRETGVVIKGMLIAEQRQTVTVKGVQEIGNAAKNPPNPEYPFVAARNAAE
jgi:hypothetical protein